MKIAIIADDTKKELMCQFCTAYCGILCKHELAATGVTARYISDSTGLAVESLMSGEFGGEAQIASRISYGEVDLLIDFTGTRPGDLDDPNFTELLRLCSLYNVPVAINIGTAEALVIALDRGDLDWRLYINDGRSV